MSKARTQIGIAALAILGFIGTAAAQGPSRREGGPGHRGPREGGPIERLDLTDQQKDQILSIREKHRAENQPLFETAQKAHQAFRKALEKDGADAQSVGQAALAMRAAQKKLEAALAGEREEVKSILTPEQREKFEASEKRRRESPDGPGFGPRRRAGPSPEGESQK